VNIRPSLYLAISILPFSIDAALAGEPLQSISSASAMPSSQPRAAAPKADPAIDPQALERAKTKFAHALAVVDQFKAMAEAEGVTGDQWRATMLGNLMKGAEANFAAVSYARSYADAMSASFQVAREGNNAMPAGKASAVIATSAGPGDVADALGDATTDLVYVPITPCRILDTRADGGSAIPANTEKTYNYYGANIGASTSCTVLSGGAAFAANVTVVTHGLGLTAPSYYLQIYPQGSSSFTTFVSFGPDQTIGNAGVISVNQANGQFTMNASGQAHVVIDAYGVFSRPRATALECKRVSTTHVTLNKPDTYLFSGGYCPAGYTLVSSSMDFAGDSGYLYTRVQGLGFSYLQYTGASSVEAWGINNCCRVPGRFDDPAGGL